MEEWRKIPGFRDEYEASSLGRVRRLEAVYHTTHHGKPVTRSKPPRILAGVKLSQKGYPRINLQGRGSFVHRLIAAAFLPNPHGLPQINHLNGNKTDNCVENLEWVSNQTNRDHAVALGLHPFGERCNSKLTTSDIRKIRKLAESGISQREIARRFGIIQQTVSGIVRRKQWVHVTD